VPFQEIGFPLPTLENPVSQLCTENQFFSDIYNSWCAEIREEPRLHRKQWEYAFILQALSMNNMLSSGRNGLGFGVGAEPLPAVMVNHGCSLVVSDLDLETADQLGWVKTNEYSGGLKGLNDRGICDQAFFELQVTFRLIDMNRIPDSVMREEFDFVWSSCSLEHLGSIDKGIEFILNSLRCLKPGGVAVHTTEYNVSSDGDTLDGGNTVLFRRRDIRELQEVLSEMGIRMSFNPHYGNGPNDLEFDEPPYCPSPHVKMLLESYVSTSVGLIITKDQ